MSNPKQSNPAKIDNAVSQIITAIAEVSEISLQAAQMKRAVEAMRVEGNARTAAIMNQLFVKYDQLNAGELQLSKYGKELEAMNLINVYKNQAKYVSVVYSAPVTGIDGETKDTPFQLVGTGSDAKTKYYTLGKGFEETFAGTTNADGKYENSVLVKSLTDMFEKFATQAKDPKTPVSITTIKGRVLTSLNKAVSEVYDKAGETSSYQASYTEPLDHTSTEDKRRQSAEKLDQVGEKPMTQSAIQPDSSQFELYVQSMLNEFNAAAANPSVTSDTTMEKILTEFNTLADYALRVMRVSILSVGLNVDLLNFMGGDEQ